MCFDIYINLNPIDTAFGECASHALSGKQAKQMANASQYAGTIDGKYASHRFKGSSANET